VKTLSVDVWELGVVPGEPERCILYSYDPDARVPLGTYDLNDCRLSCEGGGCGVREVVLFVMQTRGVRATLTLDAATGFPVRARFFESAARRPKTLTPSRKV
jgi:hypothetical protein